MTMTYEAYLDEVTTLIVEKYNASDAAAIKMVVAAQDKEFFVRHDEDGALRNEEQAHKDAKAIFSAYAPSKPAKPAAAAKPAGAARTSGTAAAGPGDKPSTPLRGARPGKPRR